ncbi:MAG TPA: translocation protein TolB [Terriglobales bacterium]|nr:translocation protein TolB [Terriglobales bacterium]
MIRSAKLLPSAILILAFCSFAAPLLAQQAQITTGLDINAPNKLRLAVPDFKAASPDGTLHPLQKVFDDTLFNDLDQSGIFDVVSRSLYPTTTFGSPEELCGAFQGCPGMAAWANAPASANMVALGNMAAANNQLTVMGWLLDAKNGTAPPILGKEYHGDATEPSARLMAHQFADAIIQRLGGGLPGIAESKIYFIHQESAHAPKELWVMDYDGANPRQLTHLNSIALSPAVSPDGTRVAFTSFAHGKADIAMFSVELGRVISFPRFAGTNTAPAWSPDGTRLAFSSSAPGDPEIYVCEVSNCSSPRRVTAYRGPDTQPVWNPKTGAQIVWVSGRASDAGRSIPQIFEMAADGTNVQRVTDGGYAVSPAWEPTQGLFLAFSWDRRYGPGAPGAPDIYILDMANPSRWEQLTHNGGRNDYPSWSPDGRHIAYQSKPAGHACEQIWTMLANGQKPTQITHSGCNTQPSWGK